MKKFLLKGIAAVAIIGSFVGCSKDVDLGGEYNSTEFNIMKNYEDAFITRFGQPAETQDWGFGRQASATTRALTRSQSSPSVAQMDAPYDAAWVADYLTTAKEPNDQNIWDNHDNSYTESDSDPAIYNPVGDASTVCYGGSISDAKLTAFINKWIKPYFTALWWGGSWSDVEGATDQASAAKIVVAEIAKEGYNFSDLINGNPGSTGTYHPDETYVRNFKITGTWNGYIDVVTSEGLANGVPSNSERTVVVTGTWNITEDQKVGGKGRIIVANGGKINIAEGKKLNSVNEAQIVVLSGGEISGAGSIEFSNGTDESLQSYIEAGGTINVGKFNNNGGNFFNYGTLKATTMDGGAANSCYYNHGVVHVGSSSSSANIRIYNNCQWYVDDYFRLKILENLSYFHVGGRLETIASEDGTGQGAYVALGNGALVEAGSLHNTNTIWTGSTTGTSVASFGSIYHLDWTPGNPTDGPLADGYFENNIYVKIADQTNAISGSAGSQTAKQVFWPVVANGQGQGNGNVKEVKDGDTEILPASDGFVAGESGCSPGFTGDVDEEQQKQEEEQEKEEEQQEEEQQEEEGYKPTPTTFVCRVIAEDLTVNENTDFDFNDVVFDVYINDDGKTSTIRLQAAGGTLPLYIGAIDDEHEVHKLFKVGTGDMVNTNMGPSKDPVDFLFNGYCDTAEEVRKKIGVWVSKGGSEPLELKAPTGGVPSKIAVGEDYPWCDEREDIDKKWSMKDNTKNFSDWVRGYIIGDDWYQMVIREAENYRNKKKNP